jgi:hypothetical protein
VVFTYLSSGSRGSDTPNDSTTAHTVGRGQHTHGTIDCYLHNDCAMGRCSSTCGPLTFADPKILVLVLVYMHILSVYITTNEKKLPLYMDWRFFRFLARFVSDIAVFSHSLLLHLIVGQTEWLGRERKF